MASLGTQDPADMGAAVRRRLLWAYSLGDAGTGMAANLIGFYLFVFYTSAAGLPAWMAGLVLMLARLWDAINDPVVGWLSDRTRSPWGPRLPWLTWSAIPLGVSMSLMWWLPPGSLWLKFGFFLLISILANSLYTCVNLPYSALAAELTTSVPLRTRLNTARFTGSICAGLAGLVLGALLLQDHTRAENYWRLGVASGVLISLSTLLCAWGLAPIARSCQRPAQHQGSSRRLLRSAASNPRFRLVLGLYLLLWCALQIMQTAALIFLPVVMRVPEGWSNWILLPFQLVTLLGLQLWTWVANRRDRIRALHLGTVCWLAGCGMAMLLAPLDPALPMLVPGSNLLRLGLLLLAILLVGLGASTAYLIPWSLLPDAIDADPDTPAGLYSAFMVFTQKICISIALLLFGNLLSFSGYRASLGADQPGAALLAIRLCMGLIPASLVVLGLLLMRRWPRPPHTAGLSSPVPQS
ncbi:MAG: MFS transporter [Synechococcaceae cyanobacterium]|nr:MFS transporter [Synechococcaceae cyanobacterium]